MRSNAYLPPALMDFLRGEAGTSFAEYALVALLVAVVCAIAIIALRKGT